MIASPRTLNQRIFCAEDTLPVLFDQLQVSYDDHRDAEALDELVVPCIELRRRSHDTYYVLVYVAEATTSDPQDQAIGYIAVDSIASSHLSSPPAHSLLQKLSRKSTSTTPRAQVIDHLPHDDVLRRHTFLAPCPLACIIAAGLSVGTQVPSPGHGKPRSSWFAALMFWLVAGERADGAFVANDGAATVCRTRCALGHDFARRTGAAGWKAKVEQLEKEVAREGKRTDCEKV